MNTKRIYLDHAATSWPKSPDVLEAMDRCAAELGAAGRGAYASAAKADSHIQILRRRLSQLIDAESPSEISLHCNGTMALNAAIHGLIRPGDHVVTTAADHNSVLRPLHFLSKRSGVELTVVPCDQYGFVSADAVLSHVQPNTRLVAMTHASNVTGCVLPVEEVGVTLSDRETMFLVDAAQTLGYVPVSLKNIRADLLAAPGHKGTGGPLGTGLLYVASAIQNDIIPVIQGGTGSASESLSMPDRFPDKLEAGNLNVPALAGWSVALGDLDQSSVGLALVKLSGMMHEMLANISSVRLFSKPGPLAVASLQMDGLSPMELAVILDTEFGVEA